MISLQMLKEPHVHIFDSRLSAGEGEECGSEYLQTFAKVLKTEFLNKSIQDIFTMVDTDIKVSCCQA